MLNQNSKICEVSSDYAVQMHGINKYFGSSHVLDDMNLDVKRGTIHSLLGENGAGKSTLMNVLYGLLTPNSGQIYLNGTNVTIRNPSVAIEHGIGMVHQHFMLVDNFTVTQNIILGNETTKGGIILDMAKAKQNVLGLVARYGLEIEPDALVSHISVGMQQRVEILKTLYRGAQTLILDEPTAVLTPQEIQELIQIMKQLVADGKTIIIITHKLKEIQDSSDFCTIIRRGKYIETVPVAGCSEEDLATMMVGHRVSLVVDKPPVKPGRTVLDIRNLKVKNEQGIWMVNDLNLQVHAGEIVGLAGIDGNGQKELMGAVNNLQKAQSGTISVDGVEIQNTSPRNVIDKGLSTIPADRLRYGLVLEYSCAENAILEKYRSGEFSKGAVIDRKRMKAFMKDLITEYDIRPENCTDKPSGGLSGGNQQKIIIGREIANHPKVLVAVQPTRGLDVGAIENIHRILVRERTRGVAILLISYELDEIMNLSDRIAVIYDGRISGVFDQGEVTKDQIGLLMGGGHKT